MSRFPKDPKKIQATITKYEKALDKEQQRYGAIQDGTGIRYLLGPLYLLKGDNEGALRSFRGFEQRFPDDIGEPGPYLCWTLALYRNGQMTAAAQKLLETMLMNLSLIPDLLGLTSPPTDLWQTSNWSSPAYLQDIPPEFFALWDPAALTWASEVYQSEPFQKIQRRYIEIYRQLKKEPVGPKRSQLVQEATALRNIPLE